MLVGGDDFPIGGTTNPFIDRDSVRDQEACVLLAVCDQVVHVSAGAGDGGRAGSGALNELVLEGVEGTFGV